jgi:sugar/nucleoside kinase (ribokinase family)
VRLEPGDWVFTSGYTLSYPKSREALADWIESLPAKYALLLDPAPVVGDIPRPILSRVLARTTWLSCNAKEASAIAGPGDVDTIAARLMRIHCPNSEGVVIRSGEQGCFVRLADGRSEAIRGFQVEAIDTNGAGDTHIGAFVSALLRGWDPFQAALYANAAAAIAVTRHGGSSSPTDAEVEAFLDRSSATRRSERAQNTRLPAC